MTLIKVTPELLDAQARILNMQTLEYIGIYTRILQEKSDLENRWHGETNQSYCAQLEAFRNDFIAMEKLFKQYALYISSAASQYRDTEQALANEANAKLKLI